MEFVKPHFYLLLSCLALCTACGSQQIKGQSPFVGISSMSVEENTLSTIFDIHNINDVELDIDAIDITIRGHDIELVHYVKDINLKADPNTTEEATLEAAAGSDARHLLTQLEGGEISSLPFTLEGRIHTQKDGYLSFKQEGHLYPVPGRPGQFRSASSSTRDRR